MMQSLDLVTIEANGLGETFQILAGYGQFSFCAGQNTIDWLGRLSLLSVI